MFVSFFLVFRIFLILSRYSRHVSMSCKMALVRKLVSESCQVFSESCKAIYEYCKVMGESCKAISVLQSYF